MYTIWAHGALGSLSLVLGFQGIAFLFDCQLYHLRAPAKLVCGELQGVAVLLNLAWRFIGSYK